MKKIFVLLYVFIYASGFEISFNKNFTQYVKPDQLYSNIIITILKEDESEVSPIIGKFLKIINSNDKIKTKNGTTSISPKYKYYKGSSEIIGYNGDIRYQILSSNSEDINSFIKELLDLKDDEDILISISSLKWIISDIKYAQVFEDLQLNAIVWARSYVTKLSIKLNKECNIKIININNFNNMVFNNVSVVKMTQTDTTSMLKSKLNKNTLHINPFYILECK
jgi:hypothetical protein